MVVVGGGGEANHQPIIDCMYDLLSKSQSQVCLNFSPPSLSLYLCCGLYFSYINPNAQVNEDWTAIEMTLLRSRSGRRRRSEANWWRRRRLCALAI